MHGATGFAEVGPQINWYSSAYVYFEEFDVSDDLKALCLCDSSEIVIPVETQSAWSLGNFYSKNNLQVWNFIRPRDMKI